MDYVNEHQIQVHFFIKYWHQHSWLKLMNVDIHWVVLKIENLIRELSTIDQLKYYKKFTVNFCNFEYFIYVYFVQLCTVTKVYQLQC